MISKKMEDAFNKQINEELYSAYLYQSLSAFAARIGLEGFANWFQIQVQEEISHSQKFYSFISERGGKIKFLQINEPPAEFGSPLELFELTLEHEQHITKCINNLMNLAVDEKDHASQIFLQWYITEQVEEENNVKTILDKLKLVGKEGHGLFMIDKDLSTRVFTPIV